MFDLAERSSHIGLSYILLLHASIQRTTIGIALCWRGYSHWRCCISGDTSNICRVHSAWVSFQLAILGVTQSAKNTERILIHDES
jgi:hypothetical protein